MVGQGVDGLVFLGYERLGSQDALSIVFVHEDCLETQDVRRPAFAGWEQLPM